jgi:hypothetical protein
VIKNDILIYCAGPLSATEVNYIKNVHRNIQTSIKIKKAGYSVVTPSNDLLVGLQAGDYGYEDYANNALQIMKRCDIVYLDEGWEKSKGCLQEKVIAEKYNIPVVLSFYELNTVADLLLNKRRLEDIE